MEGAHNLDTVINDISNKLNELSDNDSDLLDIDIKLNDKINKLEHEMIKTKKLHIFFNAITFGALGILFGITFSNEKRRTK